MKSRTATQNNHNSKSSVESIESPNFRTTTDSRVDYPEDQFTSYPAQKSQKPKTSQNPTKSRQHALDYSEDEPELDFSPEVIIQI